MHLDDLQEVLDSIDLVDDYHNKSAIKDLVKTRFIYKNNTTPVTSYVSNLVRFSPFFAERWRTVVTQGKELGQRRHWTDSFKGTFQERLDHFLEECYANQPELSSVKGKAFAAYTGKQLSPADLQRLRQIQSLPYQQQGNALAALLGTGQNKKADNNQGPEQKSNEQISPEEQEANNIRGIEDDIKNTNLPPTTLTTSEAEYANHPEDHQTNGPQIPNHPDNSLTGRFADIGQEPPSITHPPVDQEVIHASEEAPTARQANVPVNIVNRARSVLINPGNQERATRVARDVASSGEIALTTQAAPAARRATRSFFESVTNQIPILSTSRRPPRNLPGRGIVLPFSRGVSGGNFLTKKVAAQTKIIFAIIIGIMAFIGLFFFQDVFNPNATLCGPTGDQCPQQKGNTQTPTNVVIIEKDGPDSVDNGANIAYQIVVNYTGAGQAKISIIDTLPPETNAVDYPNGKLSDDGKTVTWSLTDVVAGTPKIMNISIKPKDGITDFWAVNEVRSNVTNVIGGTGGSGVGLLPSPLTPAINNWDSVKQTIINNVNRYPEVVAAYKNASSVTGVPWELLAGLHYIETGSNPNPNASLRSGRQLGVVEPDIPQSECAGSTTPGLGKPIMIGNGCGFTQFSDSAINSALFMIHLNGDKIPSSFEEAVKTASKYNGGGNTNCGEAVPYGGCPATFPGEDDPYALAMFDDRHAAMYLIFCGDRQRCSTPQPFGRPGVLTVIRALDEP